MQFFDLSITSYNLRNKNLLRLPKANTSQYGTDELCFEESIIWNTVPN